MAAGMNCNAVCQPMANTVQTRSQGMQILTSRYQSSRAPAGAHCSADSRVCWLYYFDPSRHLKKKIVQDGDQWRQVTFQERDKDSTVPVNQLLNSHLASPLRLLQRTAPFRTKRHIQSAHFVLFVSPYVLAGPSFSIVKERQHINRMGAIQCNLTNICK